MRKMLEENVMGKLYVRNCRLKVLIVKLQKREYGVGAPILLSCYG